MLVVLQVNSRVVLEVRLPMHHSEISMLVEQQALSLAQQHSDFDAVIGNKPILGHQLVINTESLSVDLHLSVEADKKKKTLVGKRSRVDHGTVS